MKCNNEKCTYRKKGICTIFEDKDIDMVAEDFIDNNVCGWVDKLTN